MNDSILPSVRNFILQIPPGQVRFMGSRWHWALAIVFILHCFFILLFLKEMHRELPLAQSRRDGSKVQFSLVFFWYLSPIPSVTVSAFAFNDSRLAGKHGFDGIIIGFYSWIIIGCTGVFALIEAIYANALLDSNPNWSSDKQRAIHRGWLVSGLYTTVSVCCLLIIIRTVLGRSEELGRIAQEKSESNEAAAV